MRPRFLALAIVLILVTFGLAACGGGDPETIPEREVRETATAAPDTDTVSPPTQTPTERPAGEPDATPRLPVSAPSTVPATGEPEPTAPPQATPPIPATAAPEADSAMVRILAEVSCIDDYRRTLLNYVGPADEVFGAEVAERLSDEFVARRQDCADLGWNPGFPVDPAGLKYHGRQYGICNKVIRVGGHDVPLQFMRVEFGRVAGVKATSAGTVLNDDGFREVTSVIVHFDPLPLQPDAWGCWVGDRGSWLYSEEKMDGPERVDGFDPPKFPECENLLRTILSDVHGLGESVGVDGVLGAMDLARSEFGEDCGVSPGGRYQYWGLYPQEDSRAGCSVPAMTGALPGGGLVINWQPDFPDALGGSACWVLSPEGEWSHDYPPGGLRSRR